MGEVSDGSVLPTPPYSCFQESQNHLLNLVYQVISQVLLSG